LFAAYVEAKQAQNVLDYDDLLLYWAQTVAEPALADDIGGRFDHVLVDEYQDTNRLQSSILLALKPGGRASRSRRRRPVDLFLPRGDRPQHPRFPHAFSPAADIITLDRNYRSTQPILAAPMGDRTRRERFTKNLWTSANRRSFRESSACATRPIRPATSPSACWKTGNRREPEAAAVLFRASHHSGPLELELTRRNIPFVKFGGLKFLDSAHVKDMLAVLRFAQNPRDRVAASASCSSCLASGRRRRGAPST